MLIPRQAQKEPDSFFNYLGTDSLRIYENDELIYAQRPQQLINHLTQPNFQALLSSIEGGNQTWEIRQGANLLLDNQVNNLELAVSINRLERGLVQQEFSLGQALCGHWLIEDVPLNQSPLPSFVSTLTQEIQGLNRTISQSKTIEKSISLNNNLEVNEAPKLSLRASFKPLLKDVKDSSIEVNSSVNSYPINFQENSPNDDFDKADFQDIKSSEEFYETENLPLIGLDTSSQSSSNSSMSNQQINQQLLHHLFEQLNQQKRLRFHNGKGILTLNGETLVAQLNEDNQWEYVSGTLSQETLIQLKSFLNNSSLNSQSITL